MLFGSRKYAAQQKAPTLIFRCALSLCVLGTLPQCCLCTFFGGIDLYRLDF